LNVDTLLSWCGIPRGGRARGEFRFDFYDQELCIRFECCVSDPGDSWLRLRYQIHDYWTGKPHDIDDLIIGAGKLAQPRCWSARSARWA
jgi:hypothetical protein